MRSYTIPNSNIKYVKKQKLCVKKLHQRYRGRKNVANDKSERLRIKVN